MSNHTHCKGVASITKLRVFWVMLQTKSPSAWGNNSQWGGGKEPVKDVTRISEQYLSQNCPRGWLSCKVKVKNCQFVKYYTTRIRLCIKRMKKV